MSEGGRPSDDTPDPGDQTMRNKILRFPTVGERSRESTRAAHAQANLAAAKAAAGLLTTAGMRTLRAWLDEQIGKRDG